MLVILVEGEVDLVEVVAVTNVVVSIAVVEADSTVLVGSRGGVSVTIGGGGEVTVSALGATISL